VVGKDGVMETTDAGETWKAIATLPPEYKFGTVGPNFGYDPNTNIIYASSMGKPAYKLAR
jgi:hypothetical protein